MGVASGCGEQEVGMASGSGWNLWVWLLGVVVRRYIDFLILLIPLFCSSIPTFCSFFFQIQLTHITITSDTDIAARTIIRKGGPYRLLNCRTIV